MSIQTIAMSLDEAALQIMETSMKTTTTITECSENSEKIPNIVAASKQRQQERMATYSGGS